MAVLRVDLSGSNLGDGLADAVLLEEVRLLEPLLAYRRSAAHVVVVLEVGLRGDRHVLLVVRYLARGVDVYLGLHAVELDVGDSAVSRYRVSAGGGVALGEAVALFARGLAGVAHRAHRVQIEGVAFLRAVHARLVAGAHYAGDEVAERHRDAGDKVGVGRLARVVEGYAGNLSRGLADAVGLESLDLLEPLLRNAARAAHRVVVLELHLAQVFGADLGHELAGGVEVDLALNRVDLAVDNHALAVEGHGVDVHVRLGEAVRISRGVARAAVAEGQVGYHVEAHGQLALGDLKRGVGPGLRGGRRGNSPFAGVLDHGDAAAAQQTDAQKQGKRNCSQLFHLVITSRLFFLTGQIIRSAARPSPGPSVSCGRSTPFIIVKSITKFS